MARDDDDDGDSDWDEDDSAYEDADFGAEPIVPCPACGRDVLEDCDHCPACGHWRDDDAEPAPKPTWVLVTAIGCLVAAMWWILRRP